MADVVEREDVNEAMRLMEMSKQSLYDDEQSSRWVWPRYYSIIIEKDDVIVNIVLYYRKVRPIDAIYGVIREMSDPDTVR